ncbi:hypothetical protein HDU89_001059 [Geranomyces variabilis]|nr:hypothetical protein HDU89_001059 [Geranomyces variabilis]
MAGGVEMFCMLVRAAELPNVEVDTKVVDRLKGTQGFAEEADGLACDELAGGLEATSMPEETAGLSETKVESGLVNRLTRAAALAEEIKTVLPLIDAGAVAIVVVFAPLGPAAVASPFVTNNTAVVGVELPEPAPGDFVRIAVLLESLKSEVDATTEALAVIRVVALISSAAAATGAGGIRAINEPSASREDRGLLRIPVPRTLPMELRYMIVVSEVRILQDPADQLPTPTTE